MKQEISKGVKTYNQKKFRQNHSIYLHFYLAFIQRVSPRWKAPHKAGPTNIKKKPFESPLEFLRLKPWTYCKLCLRHNDQVLQISNSHQQSLALSITRTPVSLVSVTEVTGQEFPFSKNNAIIISINFGHAQTGYHSGTAMLHVVPLHTAGSWALCSGMPPIGDSTCSGSDGLQEGSRYAVILNFLESKCRTQPIIFRLRTINKSFQKFQQHEGNINNQNKAENL